MIDSALRTSLQQVHCLSTSTFLSFSDEILLLIFDYLLPDNEAYAKDPEAYRLRLYTLKSLVSTCKRFSPLAQECLYRDFVKPDTLTAKKPTSSNSMPLTILNPSYNPSEQSFIGIAPVNPTLHTFSETIQQRPDLAAHIRSIRLDRWASNSILEGDLVEDHNHQRVIPHLASHSGQVRSCQWCIPASPGLNSEYHAVSTILTLAKNVQSLNIAVPLAGNNDYCSAILAHLFNRSMTLNIGAARGNHFNRLHSIVIRFDGVPIGTSPKSIHRQPLLIASIFRLASVRNLRLDGWLEDKSSEDVYYIAPAVSNIQHLAFHNCGMQPDSLSLLTQACKKLQSFELTSDYGHRFIWSTHSTPAKDHHVMEAGQVRKLLARHRHTLETITIDLAGWPLPSNTRYAVLPLERKIPFGNSELRGFTSLRHLHISQLLLLGDCCLDPSRMGVLDAHSHTPPNHLANILPPSLQTLSLMDCAEALPRLGPFAAKVPTQFPMLSRVVVGHVCLPRTARLDDPAMLNRRALEDTIRRLRAIGVEVELVNRNPYHARTDRPHVGCEELRVLQGHVSF